MILLGCDGEEGGDCHCDEINGVVVRVTFDASVGLT